MNTSYSRASRSLALATSVVGLLVGLPAAASAQGNDLPVPSEVGILVGGVGSLSTLANAVFWDQVEAARAVDAELPAAAQAAVVPSTRAARCAVILAGPRREAVLLSGDCTLADLTVAEAVAPVAEVDEGGLVTLTPEPGTLALLAAPIALVLVGLRRRRQASVV